MKIPLHLSPSDKSEKATLRRIELHTDMAMVTRGQGFRYPSSKTQKKRVLTRMERLAKSLEGVEV